MEERRRRYPEARDSDDAPTREAGKLHETYQTAQWTCEKRINDYRNGWATAEEEIKRLPDEEQEYYNNEVGGAFPTTHRELVGPAAEAAKASRKQVSFPRMFKISS